MGRRFGILVGLLALSGLGVFLGTFLGTRSPSSSSAPADSGSWASHRVRVEVLNGGGVSGVAWEATRILRNRGFDVVSYGNAETYTNDSSVVMDRVGEMKTAARVADALGIPHFRSEPDTTLYVDVTVRLGPEWKVTPDAPQRGDGGRAWWDPRRLFSRGGGSAPDNPTGP